MGKKILNRLYKKRIKQCHKYDFGSLLVIGGSKLYHGSPAFNALAAYRSGVDLVTIIAPERAADLVAGFSPDLITYPLKGDFMCKKHINTVMDFVETCDAIVIGGGMGREKKTKHFVRKFLDMVNKPVVVDADAIRALSITDMEKNFLITPHKNEFKDLTGESPNEKNLKSLGKKVGCVVVKGHVDIVSDGNKTEKNNTGSVYMTVGGTGDTLAGIAGSLLAQGNTYFDSGLGAAYINGKAGEMAAKEKKQGMMAFDIIDKIPDVVK